MNFLARADAMTIRFALLATAFLLLAPTSYAADETIHSFTKIQLTDQFWSEGIAIADINRDGHVDVVSGPYWYEGPDFKKRHAFYPATQTFRLTDSQGKRHIVPGFEGALGKQNAYSDNFFAFTYDFNHDGWPDILIIGFPSKQTSWYENPGKKGLAARTPWRQHVAFDVVNNESPTFGDLLGTGEPVLVFMTGGYVGYATPDWKNPVKKWTFHAVSAQGEVTDDPYIHGLGYGDVNGDGRSDILGPDGWWEQPASLQGDPVWKFHRWSFLQPRPEAAKVPLPDKPTEEEVAQMEKYHEWPYALGGAEIYAYDVNEDGLPDIISSLNAHGYGLAWFEQHPTRGASGEIRFRPHVILDATPKLNQYGIQFSQLHALALADIDGDGLKDILTGKRFWSHGPDGDPEPNAPAVLYWFKLVRNADKSVDFIPYLIDGNSGVGEQVAVGDIKGDGLSDIAVANKKGTFVFLHKVSKVSRERWLKAQPKAQFDVPK
jgi:hypothetical protein